MTPIEKLRAYEATGYEPEEIAPKRTRVNFFATTKEYDEMYPEQASIMDDDQLGQLINDLKILLEREYCAGYADGVKAKNGGAI
jgi:hypothetical protein